MVRVRTGKSSLNLLGTGLISSPEKFSVKFMCENNHFGFHGFDLTSDQVNFCWRIFARESIYETTLGVVNDFGCSVACRCEFFFGGGGGGGLVGPGNGIGGVGSLGWGGGEWGGKSFVFGGGGGSLKIIKL